MQEVKGVTPLELEQFKKAYPDIKKWDQANIWIAKGGRHDYVHGCWIPKPGRSYYQKVCACGRQKRVCDDFTTWDCYRYCCEICEPECCGLGPVSHG